MADHKAPRGEPGKMPSGEPLVTDGARRAPETPPPPPIPGEAEDGVASPWS